MKVAQINTNNWQSGATLAALRLHHGLLGLGINSQFLFEQGHAHNNQFNIGLSAWGRARFKIDRTIGAILGGRDSFMLNVISSVMIEPVNRLNFDIFNLHVMRGGFLSVNEIACLNAPVVWTIHDMWPFTGGCTYSSGCQKFVSQCIKCPINGDSDGKSWVDLAWVSHQWRLNAWKSFSPILVAPSHWMADNIKRSKIFAGKDVVVIPNGLDVTSWRPSVNVDLVCNKYNLPKGKKFILFGAVGGSDDYRKGYDLLVESLNDAAIQLKSNDVHAVVFGGREVGVGRIGSIELTSIGRILGDEALIELYSACDVFVAPSREDNLPTTVIEALACGVPVAGFRIGGMPDIVSTGAIGHLATAYDTADLADGIYQFLFKRDRGQLRKLCNDHVKDHFSVDMQTKKYTNLYQNIVMNKEKVN